MCTTDCVCKRNLSRKIKRRIERTRKCNPLIFRLCDWVTLMRPLNQSQRFNSNEVVTLCRLHCKNISAYVLYIDALNYGFVWRVPMPQIWATYCAPFAFYVQQTSIYFTLFKLVGRLTIVVYFTQSDCFLAQNSMVLIARKKVKSNWNTMTLWILCTQILQMKRFFPSFRANFRWLHLNQLVRSLSDTQWIFDIWTLFFIRDIIRWIWTFCSKWSKSFSERHSFTY